ncbi:MAG: hypothetical protein AAFZ58_05300, partial [Pseudomonadota bacterium]
NTAFVFPNLNMRAEQAKRLFKDYREFMPLPLYQQMALDWQQHQAAGRSRSAWRRRRSRLWRCAALLTMEG